MLYFDDMILRKRLLEDSNEALGYFYLLGDYENVRRIIKIIDIECNHSAFARA